MIVWLPLIFAYVEKASIGRRVVFYFLSIKVMFDLGWRVLQVFIWHGITCLKLLCGLVDINVISLMHLANLA